MKVNSIIPTVVVILNLGLAACGPTPTPQALPVSPTDTPPPSAPPDMVYVPAGEFLMGSDPSKDEHALNDEQPAHTVYLDAFYIDRAEVTSAQFAQFLNEQGNQIEAFVVWLETRYEDCPIVEDEGQYQPRSGYEDHPVVYVNWYGARAYCQWAGKRLPTEAEWEKAARGTDGRVYPWGNTFDGSKLNFCDRNCSAAWKDASLDDGYAGTAPVGSYPAGSSPYGALDMAGNVLEWVADWHGEDYYSQSPRNPPGPELGRYRVLRGGSWFNAPDLVRSTNRTWYGPGIRLSRIGFRCARSAP